MKPIYKSLALAAMTLSVSLSLQAKVNDGESVTESAVLASSLDGLKVELVSPNVTGARDLIASGECVIDGENLTISLNAGDWIKGATYSVRVSAVFGTQTVVLYVLNVSVPRYEALASETQEYEDEIVVVSTFGDGTGSTITVDPVPTEGSENPVASGGVYNALQGKADGSLYSKDGEGNAKITTPLSVGGGVASSDGAVAHGKKSGEDTEIQANAAGSFAGGEVTGYGTFIRSTGKGACAHGYARTDSSGIVASGNGSFAGGEAAGDGTEIQATGNGSFAFGQTADPDHGYLKATGAGSQAFGIGVQATQEGQMVVGKCNVVDEDDTYQFIVGNGADDRHRHNAFAVTKSGELALFKADGTPVILTAAYLEALIASLPTT